MRAVGFELVLDHEGMRNWLSGGRSAWRGGPVGTGGRPCRRVVVVLAGAGAGSRSEETTLAGAAAAGGRDAGGEYGGAGSLFGAVEW